MENYIGVKEVKATPMSKELAIVSGYKTGDSNEKEGYEVEYEGGYKSWSPKDVFEAAYRKTSGLTFGLAIEAMKKGKLVAREGWNGKGMFIFIRPSDELPIEMIVEKVKSLPESVKHFFKEKYNGDYIKSSDSEPFTAKFGAYICMKTPNDEIVNGWLASQTDILAEDWMIIESCFSH